MEKEPLSYLKLFEFIKEHGNESLLIFLEDYKHLEEKDLLNLFLFENNDLLKKYNYTRKYIVEKIFDEDLIIGNGQIVIDKNTNISLTKEDIERNKEEYINELITEFDNFINMYIDNKTLVIVYNKSELRNMFFDNEFDSELIVRYLK